MRTHCIEDDTYMNVCGTLYSWKFRGAGDTTLCGDFVKEHLLDVVVQVIPKNVYYRMSVYIASIMFSVIFLLRQHLQASDQSCQRRNCQNAIFFFVVYREGMFRLVLGLRTSAIGLPRQNRYVLSTFCECPQAPPISIVFDQYEVLSTTLFSRFPVRRKKPFPISMFFNYAYFYGPYVVKEA